MIFIIFQHLAYAGSFTFFKNSFRMLRSNFWAELQMFQMQHFRQPLKQITLLSETWNIFLPTETSYTWKKAYLRCKIYEQFPGQFISRFVLIKRTISDHICIRNSLLLPVKNPRYSEICEKRNGVFSLDFSIATDE